MSNQKIQSIILLLLAIIFFLTHIIWKSIGQTNLFLGVATGLLAAFLVHLIFPWRLQDLSSTIDDILNIVKQVSIRIFTPQRDTLEKSKFHNEHFREAKDIYISGIALTDFVKKLTWYQDKLMNLDKALVNPNQILIQELRNRPLHVRALLMNPDSSFIAERKDTEDNDAIEDNIRESLRRLEQFKSDLQSLNNQKIQIKGQLEVKKSSRTLYFSTFQVDYGKEDRTDVLYFGLLFSFQFGSSSPFLSIYDTGQQKELYSKCRFEFLAQFNKADSVLRWNEDGVT